MPVKKGLKGIWEGQHSTAEWNFITVTCSYTGLRASMQTMNLVQVHASAYMLQSKTNPNNNFVRFSPFLGLLATWSIIS